MKEYKLSAKSKYSVLYLLSGLFMFFFMFAIFNLSSYAKTTSFNLKTSNPRPTSFDGSCTVSFGTPSFTVNIPADSSLSQGQSKTFYYSTNLYVTTTAGTFLLRTDSYNFTATVYPSQVNTFTSDLHMTGIGSFDLDGQFISADLVLDSDDPIDYFTFNGKEYGTVTQGSYSSTYRGDVYGGMRSELKGFGISAVNSNFVTVTSSSGSSSISDIPDYASYNYVYNVADLNLNSNIYGVSTIARNTIMNYSFPDYNQSNFMSNTFYPKFVSTSLSNNYLLRIRYKGNPLTSCTFNIYQRVLDGSGETNEIVYNLDDFVFVDSAGNYRTYYLYFDTTHFDYDTYNILYFSSSANGGSFQDVSFSVLQRTYTINDYMSHLQSQYNDINPSVTDTNINTSQTVSDINTVNTFETSTFNDFDTLSESTGLNSFSLSSDTHVAAAMNYLSTCIVTVYNGFPSDLKWLIQCIGIFGIFALLLSVFGRVGKRINNE